MEKKKLLFIFLGVIFLFVIVSSVEAIEYENRVRADFISISIDVPSSAKNTINEINDSYRTTYYSFLDDMSVFKINFTISNYNSSKTYDFVMDIFSDGDYYSDSVVYCGDVCVGLDVCVFNYTSNQYQHWFCEDLIIDGDTRAINSDFIDADGNFSVVSTGDLISASTTRMWIYDLYITYNDTLNPKEIYKFNNTLTTENLDFDVSSANFTRYLKIFRTATVSFAKMMFDGYQYLSSWTKPQLEIGVDDSLVEWDYPTRNYSNEQATSYSNNDEFIGSGCTADNSIFYDDDWATGHKSCWTVVLDNVTNSDIFTIIQDANYTKEILSPSSIDYKVSYNFESNNNWGVSISCFNSSDIWEQFGLDSRQPICGSVPCNRTHTIPANCWSGSLIQLRHLINFTPSSGHEGTTYGQIYIDRELIYNYPQLKVSNEITEQFNTSINTALNSGACDCVGCLLDSNDFCLIPFHLNSSTDGGLTYDSFEVFYSSTPFFVLNTTLISPTNNTYSTNLTQDFQCNITDTTSFDGVNQTILKNVTLKIYNSSDIEVYLETKDIIGLSNLTNFTNIFTYDDNYLWSCESFNNLSYFNLSESNFTLTIDTTNPQILLLNTSENNTQYDRDSIFINVSASDTNFRNITYLLYNSTGFETISSFETLTTEKTFTSLGLDLYEYNVTICDLADNCNSTDTYNVSLNSPLINITTPKDSGTVVGNTVGITYNFSTGVISANYTITVQSSGAIEGSLENIELNLSKNTEIFAVTFYDTYILTVDAVDSVGFTSQENVTFTTVQPSAPPSSNGGGGGSPSEIDVVAIILPEDFKTLTDLQRAIIYARIFEYEDGRLTTSEKNQILANLTQDNIQLTLDELTSLESQINKDRIENIKVTESIADRYNLVRTVLVVEFKVFPRVMSGDTSFVCAVEGGELKEFKRPITANKLFESCEVVGGNWGCEISEDKTVAFIIYDIKEPDFFIQTLEGEIRYISQDGEVDRTRVISLNLVNYCAEIGNTGILVIYVVILGIVGLSAGGYFIYRKRKIIKQRFLKIFRK